MASASADHRDDGGLRARLEYLESLVQAIRLGRVDGLVVGPAGAEKLYSLTGAEHVYRLLVEQLADGVATVGMDGTLLYANQSLSSMLGPRLKGLVGSPIGELVADEDREAVQRMLAEGSTPEHGLEVSLLTDDARRVPVRISAAMMADADPAMVCLAVIDLTDTRARVAAIERASDQLRENAQALTRANLRFRAVFDQGPVAMATIDARGRYTAANPAMCEMTGYAAGEIEGRPVGSLNHLEDRETAVAAFELTAGGVGNRPNLDVRYVRRDGSTGWATVTLGAIREPGGQLIHCLEMAQDVTDRRRIEQAQRRLAAIVEHTDDAVLANTPDGVISDWNRGAERLYGYASQQAIGRHADMLIPPERVARDAEVLEQVFGGEPAVQYETVRVRKDGRRVDVALTISPILDRDGAILGASVIARDISERKLFERQLQYLADHDPLTGLFNRRRFGEELARELSRARRYRSGGAVLALDLDQFKYINDSLGHAVGDEVIVRAAELIRRRARATDVLARLGGDEFAVILPGVNADQAQIVAASLLEAIRDDAGTGATPGSRHLTASIGIAPFGDVHELSAEKAMVEADIAMYDAKETGRNRVAVYDRGSRQPERMQSRLAWADRIREALLENRFVLHAQPILSLQGDTVPRHELLVRLIDEEGQLIPPARFLRIAEQLDLIELIDRWVLSEAIRALAREQRAGAQLRLALNLSGVTISDPDIPRWIERELDAAGASGSGLCFEITETAAIMSMDQAKVFATRVGELGCELALDDFGAGFASFYYLKHLRIDYLKIDGEFIRDLSTNGTDQLVVKSIPMLARSLGERTIAEHVGDEQTLRLLRDYGVDYAQGFYVGRAKPLSETRLSAPVATPIPASPAVG